MAQDAKLDAKILGLCEEANAMLLANLLDTKKAVILRRKLLECRAQARDAGLESGARQLQQSADDLAARFPPVAE